MVFFDPIKNVKYKIVFITIFLFSNLSLLGCSEKEKPPYYTAQITNVYNEKIIIKNFKFLYWWEERGETPFLKPYNYRAKELIVELMIPFKDNPRRVSIETKHIPLEQIDSVTMVLTKVGKDMKIALKNGEELVASNNFPKLLKKGEKTGFADHKVFVEGDVIEGNKKKKLKLDINMIKHIKIIEIHNT